jgi:3-methylfumaryl-CoA hydratase
MSRIKNINVGDALPERAFKPDTAQLFLYDAALWNAHRIHFDYPYATEVEGYPGLVIAGPLMGDWLTQCVVDWLGDDGKLVSIEYSNRQAAFIGEVLRTGGSVIAVDPDTREAQLELFVKNEANDVIIPGAAVVNFTTD